jgi:hypothetical protein
MGSEVRVSPAGLPSWRSRSVKASMMSGASNARFRRPTVTWCRMPASTSRATAWLVWTKLRPIRSAALVTVRTGAPTRARSNRSVAERARTLSIRSRQTRSTVYRAMEQERVRAIAGAGSTVAGHVLAVPQVTPLRVSNAIVVSESLVLR